jgi:hypothetical protein
MGGRGLFVGGDKIFFLYSTATGHAVAQFIEALCYKPEVAGSNTDEVDFFNLFNPSSRIMALLPTQPVIEISTRAVGKGRPARRNDKLTAICEPIV